MDRNSETGPCGCRQFLGRYSEYRDGRLSPEDTADLDDHLTECPDCRRYRDVLDRAVETLRGLPVPGLSDDFRPRLQHRLLDEVDRVESRTGTRPPALPVALGAAAALALGFWAVHLDDPAEGVAEAGGTPTPVATRSAPSEGSPVGLDAPTPVIEPVPEDLWEFSRPLLFEYSPLQRGGYTGATPVRSGLD